MGHRTTKAEELAFSIVSWDIEKLYDEPLHEGPFLLQMALIRHRRTGATLKVWMLSRTDGTPVAPKSDSEWFRDKRGARNRAKELGNPIPAYSPLDRIPSAQPRRRRAKIRLHPGQLDERCFEIECFTGRMMLVEGAGYAEEAELLNVLSGMTLKGWRITWTIQTPLSGRQWEMWHSEAFVRGRLTSIARTHAPGTTTNVKLVRSDGI